MTLPLCWLGGGGMELLFFGDGGGGGGMELLFFGDTACVSWAVGWRNPYSFAVRHRWEGWLWRRACDMV